MFSVPAGVYCVSVFSVAGLETNLFFFLCPFQVKMLSVGDIIIMHDRNEIPSALHSTAKQSADF